MQYSRSLFPATPKNISTSSMHPSVLHSKHSHAPVYTPPSFSPHSKKPHHPLLSRTCCATPFESPPSYSYEKDPRKTPRKNSPKNTFSKTCSSSIKIDSKSIKNGLRVLQNIINSESGKPKQSFYKSRTPGSQGTKSIKNKKLNTSLVNKESVLYNTTSLNIAQRQIGRDNFRFVQKIGSGGFGRVWKVEFKRNSRAYAMKEISKAKQQ